MRAGLGSSRAAWAPYARGAVLSTLPDPVSPSGPLFSLVSVEQCRCAPGEPLGCHSAMLAGKVEETLCLLLREGC